MNQNQGFTLLEVIISLTLLSLIMGLLFASISIGANSWQKGETKLAEINQIATAYHSLQTYLTTALPLTNERLKQTGEINPPLAFQGNQHTIQFVSNTRMGLQLFKLKKQQDKIKINVRPFFFTPKNSNTDNIVLLQGVSDLNIQYFGTTDALKPASWHKEWLKQTKQPIALKISIQLTNGKQLPDWLLTLKIPEQDLALQPIAQ
ncbi:hypothetical protein DOJK_02300 [Patescibacteria group bacterium]|nr:hypothetical protein DOJK_02300 [Patescibacteria group bacterium]